MKNEIEILKTIASFLLFIMAFYIAMYGLDLKGSYIQNNKVVGRGMNEKEEIRTFNVRIHHHFVKSKAFLYIDVRW